MVTFRCKRSGNTVSFAKPHDIESMRKMPDYEEVKEVVEEKVEVEPPLKKRGRPAKQ